MKNITSTVWSTYRFRKQYKKKQYQYFSPNKIDCICYKFIFNLKVKAGLFKK